jgi:hypothetical protein
VLALARRLSFGERAVCSRAVTTRAPLEPELPVERPRARDAALGRPCRLARCLALGAALLGGAGCARRAPGPDECHDLAVRWILAEHGGGIHLGTRRIVLPESLVMERTTECLTTPYDQELVQCVTSGTNPRACLRAFQARRGLPPVLPAP